jgi:CheY-like chemotaxis protein
MFKPKPRLPHLLVIDDDALIQRVYARLLGRDFAVELESDATVALQRIAAGAAFDAILCDLYLGSGISGQDFLERLPPSMQARTVICSGGPSDPDHGFEASLGDRFFVKPGDTGHLIALLRRLAGHALPRAAA